MQISALSLHLWTVNPYIEWLCVRAVRVLAKALVRERVKRPAAQPAQTLAVVLAGAVAQVLAKDIRGEFCLTKVK